MAAAASPRAPGAADARERLRDTRERLIEAAVHLFACHSFAGTSLQMIADQLGITKAAVYHHFHTRDDLLTAAVGPALERLRDVVAEAGTLRTPHARAEHVLAGYAKLAVAHRALIGMLGTDPAVAEALRAHEGFAELIARQVNLLAEVHPGPQGRVSAAVALSGIASAAASPLVADLDDDTLRECLISTGRRLLGLRPPRTHTG